MRSDSDIKRDVEAELRWTPAIDAADIAVAVRDSVVTLTGVTKSFLQKYEAEDAVKRVAGVAGLANDIEVRLPAIDDRPDPEIARDAVAAIKALLPYDWEKIRVVAKAGWITLEGEVEWNYERERAERAVRPVKGAKGVTNQIRIKPHVAPTEVKKKIEEAFKRHAEIDANHIVVEADGSQVTLKGTVRSWAERQEAQRAAWMAPGVAKVENRIAVSPL